MITFLDDDVEQFAYPGGEVSVKQSREVIGGFHRALVQGADSDDLLRLAMWGQNVDRLGGWATALIPYLPAARADHEEEPVGFDAAVYAALINAGNFEEVICIDPHSPVMPGLINRCREVPVAPLVAAAVEGLPISGVIIPDKGARSRSQAVADLLGVPTFQMEKVRDFETGRLSGFALADELPAGGGDYLVADDICDGGGTFAGLAGAVLGAPGNVNVRLHLWVTHGIFSGRAADNLLGSFESIMTTDSHPGHVNISTAKVTPLAEHLR